MSISQRPKLKRAAQRWDLYVMLLLPLAWYVIFQYVPMYGLQIAFRDYFPNKGFLGSPWVGFKHFERFFSSYYFWRLLRNTLTISIFNLAVNFPVAILLALLINEIRSRTFKRIVQNITYLPHFISTVVIVGMLVLFLSPRYGVVNHVIGLFGLKPVAFMEDPGIFKALYVFSNTWQNMGWNSIIYIAALAGISPSLYEAAVMDGAGRIQKIVHISIPGIMPTVIILLILALGRTMNVGFEKVLLMQNSLNMDGSDIISTFVYRIGILKGDYSFSTAVGLFRTIINFILLFLANTLTRRYSESSLW